MSQQYIMEGKHVATIYPRGEKCRTNIFYSVAPIMQFRTCLIQFEHVREISTNFVSYDGELAQRL